MQLHLVRYSVPNMWPGAADLKFLRQSPRDRL